MKLITSRENPTFKLVRGLAHSGRERRKQGQTVLDGLHLVEAWWQRYGLPPLLIVAERAVVQPEISAFLATLPQGERVVLADTLFDEASPVDTPAGILAVVPIPELRTPPRLSGTFVALDAIQDAGNLGAILRTAAAAGIGDVLLGAGCAAAWSPRVLRAAMGAHFNLQMQEHVALAERLAGYAGRIVATALDAETSLYDLDLRGPVAWLFGNEGAGLAPELAGLATHVVRIPMPGGTESLNVAVAAAVCLFEEVRQKQTAKQLVGWGERSEPQRGRRNP